MLKKHYAFFIIVILMVIFAYPHQQGISPFDPGDYCKCAVQLLRGELDINSVYCNRLGTYLPIALAIKLFGFNGYHLSWVSVVELILILIMVYLAFQNYNREIALIACAAIGFAPLMLVYSGHLFGDIVGTLTSNLCIVWIWHYRFFADHRKQIIAGVALALIWGFAFITKEFAIYYLLPMLIFFIDDKRKKQNAQFWKASIIGGILLVLFGIVSYSIISGNFLLKLKLLEIGPNSPVASRTYYFGEFWIVIARVTILPLKFLIEHFSFFIIFLPSLIQIFSKPENEKERFLKIYLVSLLVLWWAGTTSFRSWKPLLLEDRLWFPLMVPFAINAAHVFYFIARGQVDRYATLVVKILLVLTGAFIITAAFVNEENILSMTLPLDELLLRLGLVALLFASIFHGSAIHSLVNLVKQLITLIINLVSAIINLFKNMLEKAVEMIPCLADAITRLSELIKQYYIIILLLLLPLIFNTRTAIHKNPKDNDYLADKEMIDTVRNTNMPATVISDDPVYRNHGIYYGFDAEVERQIRFLHWKKVNPTEMEELAKEGQVYLLLTKSRIYWYQKNRQPEIQLLNPVLDTLPDFVLNPDLKFELVKQNSRSSLYRFKHNH